MNYYEHHIGDYAAATAHLSLTEDAVYSRMLRRYYLQEVPLPVEVTQVARLVGARTPDELEAVRSVLGEFFSLSDDGWHNKRADAEIARYREKCAHAANSAAKRWGKKGAMPPHDARDATALPPHSLGNATAMPTHADGNAHQTPDSIHQDEQEPRASLDARTQRVVNIAQAMIRGGVPPVRVNRSDPRLVALADREPPISPDLVEAVSREGTATGKTPPWIWATVLGRLGDAARPGKRGGAAFTRTVAQIYETGALTRGELPFEEGGVQWVTSDQA